MGSEELISSNLSAPETISDCSRWFDIAGSSGRPGGHSCARAVKGAAEIPSSADKTTDNFFLLNMFLLSDVVKAPKCYSICFIAPRTAGHAPGLPRGLLSVMPCVWGKNQWSGIVIID